MSDLEGKIPKLSWVEAPVPEGLEGSLVRTLRDLSQSEPHQLPGVVERAVAVENEASRQTALAEARQIIEILQDFIRTHEKPGGNDE